MRAMMGDMASTAWSPAGDAPGTAADAGAHPTAPGPPGHQDQHPQHPQHPHQQHAPGPPPGRPWELTRDPLPGEVCLPSHPESAGVARRLVRATLQGRWMLPPDFTDNAVLLSSELVGNAVTHAGAHVFGLRIRQRRDWIRIEVRDPSRALPCRLPVRDLDVSGRGLYLVDMLADRWGVDLLPRGKSTWFEMRAPQRAARA